MTELYSSPKATLCQKEAEDTRKFSLVEEQSGSDDLCEYFQS